MLENNLEVNQAKQDSSPREWVMRYIRYTPLIIICIALGLMGAYLQLRYSVRVYSVNGKLLVKNSSPYGGGREKFDEIFMMQGPSRNMNDEIEIIKSRYMARRVVRSLGLNIMYYNKGTIRSSVIHPKETPFVIEIVNMPDSTLGASFMITILDNNRFLLNEEKKPYFFNQQIRNSKGLFVVKKTNNSFDIFKSKEFQANLASDENRATSIAGGLRVSQATDYANVLNLTYETDNIRLGKDIINQYMEEYQQSSLEDKRMIAVNTLSFIDEQLDTVKTNLSRVEGIQQQFQESNKIYNTKEQSQILLSQMQEVNKELTEQEVKLKIVDYLIKYLANPTNENRIMTPSALGIEEPSLVQQIAEYNNLQLEKETTLKNTPANNPVVQSLDAGIAKVRNDMVENLRNVRQTYVTAIRDLNSKNSQADLSLQTIPGKERKGLDIARQQKITEELFSFLLQKKLETAISSASTISNIRVVEHAITSLIPIKPNKQNIYLLALFLGLAIPISFIAIREFLNDKIKSRQDVQKATNAPILGEIGHSQVAGAQVVTANNRKFLAEQFRIIRTNLQYILPKVDKPILLVTSSFSGEGKSFVSTNLGAVLAITGKKVVVLEFDIRKPRLLKGLGMEGRKGITNFLIGNSTVEEIVIPVAGTENLNVIACGPIPPNPSELLLNEKVDNLFDQLKRIFDVIIIDSAPVGLVSDAVTLGKYSSGTVYIVRHNYTLKKQLQLVNDLYVQKKLPNMSIAINDIPSIGTYGNYYGYGNNYGYGGGYGYGYGYSGGYGMEGYFELEPKKQKSWLRKIKSKFKRIKL